MTFITPDYDQPNIALVVEGQARHWLMKQFHTKPWEDTYMVDALGLENLLYFCIHHQTKSMSYSSSFCVMFNSQLWCGDFVDGVLTD